MNHSKALDRLVHGFDLTDVWETIPPRAIYTHYTPHGVEHLDRMYLSPNVRSQKRGAETVMAAFTDNLAVRLHITLEQGRGRWKMNVFLLDETMFKGQLQQEWLQWHKQERKYLENGTWWDSDVKRKIHYMFSKEGKERSRAEAMSENFLLLLYIRRTKGPDPAQRKGHQIKPS